MENRLFQQISQHSSFVQVPSGLLRDLGERKLDAWDVVVYMIIKSHCIDKPYCWHSIPSLAREISRSQSTVERAIGKLTKAGHIYREQTGKSARTHLVSDVVNGRSTFRSVEPLRQAAAKRKSEQALERAHIERAQFKALVSREVVGDTEEIQLEDPF